MTEPALTARGPAHHGAFVEVAHGLVLAAMLAALAGMVDAIGYLHLKGLFVSFMSGNSTELAVALGQGDLDRAAKIAELIALFVLGAAAGQMLADFAGRWHMTGVLIGVALLLTMAAVLSTTPEPMVFAMGALNASMRRAGNIPVSLTFVTGVLVRFGQGLGNFLDPALIRIELARASRPLGRNGHWCDDRRRRLPADRGAGNLGSDRAGVPARGQLGHDTASGLTD